jgi:pre-mRNA-splicing factor ATP-dependent RNA helicase DHX15/PRP43
MTDNNDTKDNIGILDPDGLQLNPFTNEPYSDTYKLYAKKWSSLPAYKRVHELIALLKAHQVTLVISTTGSGKTVLLPKILTHIFNYTGKIAVTLPKQVIAKSAAEYACATLDVKMGTHVGYQYKGSDPKANNGIENILYATDGTIVAQLMKDPTLKQYDGVIIDEAHERKVQIDFLLYLLKQTVMLRPTFKLVIMSATINQDIFKNYFDDISFGVMDVGGERLFNIESIFLKSPIDTSSYIEHGMNLIKNVIKKNDGDILFFVTSVNECIDACKSVVLNGDKNDYCVEVFAGMTNEKQQLAQDKDLFKTTTSKTRKLVIATNVAESSLTIDGIKYVIDSGLEFFGYYDPKIKSKMLVKKFISRAQAVQRMGRAGRTSEGVCYHLYTQNDFDNRMDKFPKPTIAVSNISGECLRLLNIDSINTVPKLQNILLQLIEPPPNEYVFSAIQDITNFKLVTDDAINDLGKFVAQSQLDLTNGLIAYAGWHFNCIREVSAIIVMIDACKNNMGGLFIKGPKHLMPVISQAKLKLKSKYGDHIVLLKIFAKYMKYVKEQNKPNVSTESAESDSYDSSADSAKSDETSDDKLEEFMRSHFLRKDVLAKAYGYYKKMVQHIKRLCKTLPTINITDLDKYKLEHKVLAAIYYGCRFNIGYINVKNDKYKTNELENVGISRDSFATMFTKIKKELMYHELFTVNGKTDMIISSAIPKKSKELTNQLLENIAS